MASYVSPNYNPAYYELPVFEAPIEMATRVAQQKQAQFDAGLQQVKNQYNSMLNLELTSKDAIAKKDAYMKDAERKLRQIATADFSLQENVSAANQIYKPLVNDEHILLDMSATKQNKNAYSQLLSDKNSSDEKRRAGASAYNEEYIMRKQRELQNMSFEELKNYSPAKYVKAVNFNELLNKYAKDLGYGFVEQKEDGIYLRKTEGGPASFIGYNTFAKTQLSSNPDAVAYMNIVANVEYNRDVDTYTQVFGDKAQAKQHLAQESIKKEFEFRKALITEQEKENEDIKTKHNQFLADPKNGGDVGIKANPELFKIHQQFTEQYNQGEKKLTTLRSEALKYDPNNNNKTPGMDYTDYELNLKTLSIDATGAYTNSLLRTTASNWALGLSSINKGSTISANEPYFKIKENEIELIKAQTELTKAQKNLSDEKNPNVPNTELPPINVLGRDKEAVITDKLKQLKADRTVSLQKTIENQKNIAIQVLGNDDQNSDIISIISKAFDNIKSGKGTVNVMQGESQDKINKIVKIGGDAVRLGILKQGDPMTSENIYKAVTGLMSNKIKSNPESVTPEVISLFAQSEHTTRLNKIYDNIDKQVTEQVINKNPEKYKGYLGSDNSFLSEEEFINKSLNGNYRIIKGGIIQKVVSAKEAYEIYKNNNEGLVIKPDINAVARGGAGLTVYEKIPSMDEIIYDLNNRYSEKKKEFEKDFSKYLDQNPSSEVLGYFRGDSNIGMSFNRLQFGFNDKAGEQNISEQIVPRMFARTQELINSTNERNLGLTNSDQRQIFAEISTKLEVNKDLKSEDGSLTFVPMSSSGTPSYNYKPTVTSLTKIKEMYKGDGKALAIINNIEKFGITYNGSLEPSIESQTASYYSTVARSMGNENTLNLATFVTGLNPTFKGSVVKINDRQYMVKYNVIDENGKTVTERDINNGNTVIVPVERLDQVVRNTEQLIYDLFTKFKNSNKSQTGKYDPETVRKKLNGE